MCDKFRISQSSPRSIYYKVFKLNDLIQTFLASFCRLFKLVHWNTHIMFLSYNVNYFVKCTNLSCSKKTHTMWHLH